MAELTYWGHHGEVALRPATRKGHRQLRPEPAASRDQGPKLAKHVPFSLSPCPTLVQNLCLPPAQTTVTALPWASRHLPPPSRQPPHPGATIPALKTEPGQVAPPPQALLEPPLAWCGVEPAAVQTLPPSLSAPPELIIKNALAPLHVSLGPRTRSSL